MEETNIPSITEIIFTRTQRTSSSNIALSIDGASNIAGLFNMNELNDYRISPKIPTFVPTFCH